MIDRLGLPLYDLSPFLQLWSHASIHLGLSASLPGCAQDHISLHPCLMVCHFNSAHLITTLDLLVLVAGGYSLSLSHRLIVGLTNSYLAGWLSD